MQVLREPGRANTTLSYMWVMRGGPPGQPVLRYHYAASRTYLRELFEKLPTARTRADYLALIPAAPASNAILIDNPHAYEARLRSDSSLPRRRL